MSKCSNALLVAAWAGVFGLLMADLTARLPDVLGTHTLVLALALLVVGLGGIRPVRHGGRPAAARS